MQAKGAPCLWKAAETQREGHNLGQSTLWKRSGTGRLHQRVTSTNPACTTDPCTKDFQKALFTLLLTHLGRASPPRAAFPEELLHVLEVTAQDPLPMCSGPSSSSCPTTWRPPLGPWPSPQHHLICPPPAPPSPFPLPSPQDSAQLQPITPWLLPGDTGGGPAQSPKCTPSAA